MKPSDYHVLKRMMKNERDRNTAYKRRKSIEANDKELLQRLQNQSEMNLVEKKNERGSTFKELEILDYVFSRTESYCASPDLKEEGRIYVYQGAFPLVLELIYAVNGLMMLDTYDKTKTGFSLMIKIYRIIYSSREYLSKLSLIPGRPFILENNVKLPEYITKELIESMEVSAIVPLEFMTTHEKDLETATLSICSVLIEAISDYYRDTDYSYVFTFKQDIDADAYEMK